MLALHRTPAHGQRGAYHLVDCEGIQGQARTNHVDHRIHGADLVEVNRLRVAAVDLGLGRGELRKHRARPLPDLIRDVGSGQQVGAENVIATSGAQNALFAASARMFFEYLFVSVCG